MAATQAGRRVGWRNVRVLGLIAVALVLLALSVYSVGKVFNVFADHYMVVTLVPTVAGLREGAAVTLAGQRVGDVGDIEFIPLARKRDGNNVSITLSIDVTAREQVRGNSVAVIRSQGLLGDKYVDIQPGTPAAPVLEPGDTLVSATPADLDRVLATASATLDDLSLLVGDLRTVTVALAQGEGTAGRLLHDRALYDRMVTATGELTATLRGLNRSDGTFSRFLRDPALYERMTGAAARVDSLTALALHGDGSLARFLTDDALHDALLGTVSRADSTLVGFGAGLERLTSGDGTIQRLMTDPALYDQLLKAVVDLQVLLQSLREDPSQIRPQIQVDVF